MEITTLMKSEAARNLFLEGYNCTQSILYAFCEELGLPEETALKLSCGFGAGMARQGEVCGAVTGGILVLGLRCGSGPNENCNATEITYAKTQELMKLFAFKNGSSLCRELLNGCDLSTPEGQNSFKKNDYLNSICLNCVQSVVEILEQLK